ncbi:uncharacterized protein LOC131065230 isoform X1 [Cryptomeria japonica]|uniref:uncharacterized protein LOC131065230 isoform X1 n=1 Tax=Cryptomeria japonica TaxID=3369 RepID=UPI0027DA8035|nr:uncharacterized protein LOC131065230 isoform X1 [Cryptomeria japonica]XP_057855666.2 uncharacterized protein LOC131065230 isoform X1 [Cryptomeria japonica]XP_057855668.2 uncharacterized protein LOC131065230 isoform X1 [Cryptomeria japonica]XP_057855669.2 uncharacterized protein LOC131065230 isoform X1 [Cryptomeria japonica]XP_057855670.2 uncharacterized protein LOC131065230 isoform X1 [Cryptomeria japonica]XP_057855671.2 uncharacterized protein LOC131065230 isoform X1 [Cryptomeria japonica]
MLCNKAEVFDSVMYGLPNTGAMVDGSLAGKHSQRRQRRCHFAHQLIPRDEFQNEKPIDSEVSEPDVELKRSKDISGDIHCYRHQLEDDVQGLQKQLQEEIDLHATLESAIAQKAGALSSLPCDLPIDAQELLASIALLEVTISKLEEETFALHLQLSQERNERRLVEYRLKQSSSSSSSSSISPPSSDELKNQHPSSLGCSSDDNFLLQHSSDYRSFLESSSSEPSAGAIKEKTGESRRARKNLLRSNGLCKSTVQHTNQEASMKDLWKNPNQLSEQMVRCMKDIFIHLTDPVMVSSKCSPTARIHSPRSPLGVNAASSLSSFSESSSVLSFAKSPPGDFHIKEEVLGTENSFDPYSTHGKLNWADIGRYSLVKEVSWMSVGKQQLEYAAGVLRKFRLLVEQLAKVDPGCMTYDEKLAFWINIYNALMMHAYLAYGVPRNGLKLFSLMQKAAYTVGGYSFNAVDIEHVILKMKPPMHRPQIALLLALHKCKISEEHSKYVIEHSEPLVMFALSCGVYSSPAVRVFTAERVHEELQDALYDYVRASVGLSAKGKLLVPKLLHSFTKGMIEENELVDWICQFLLPSQTAVVQDCIAQRKWLLGARNFAVIPFDLRFRYLFLPENRT